MEQISFLISGLILGFSAGTSPGPLLALVITETCRHGKKSGIQVAVSPLLTDLPIILASLFLISKVSRIEFILGLVSVCGAVYVVYLGIESLKIQKHSIEVSLVKPRSLGRGFIVNITNPHPYLFWITVGSPLIIRAVNTNYMAVILFITGFYSLLIGSKIIIALITSHSKKFISDKWFRRINQAMGIVLFVFAFFLFRNAWQLFK